MKEVEIYKPRRVRDGVKFTREIAIRDNYDPIWDTYCHIEFVRFVFNGKTKTLTVLDFDRYDSVPQWKFVVNLGSFVIDGIYWKILVDFINDRTDNLVDANEFLESSIQEYLNLSH